MECEHEFCDVFTKHIFCDESFEHEKRSIKYRKVKVGEVRAWDGFRKDIFEYEEVETVEDFRIRMLK